MYECFSKNAGPYIKLGQMVGQLQMLLPQEYLDTFEPMCMQAPRTPYAMVKTIVEKEFGRPLEEIYDWFDEKPLASASLAQVHKAHLKGAPPGEYVAVKV
jgi:aarF domain-containing kinase